MFGNPWPRVGWRPIFVNAMMSRPGSYPFKAFPYMVGPFFNYENYVPDIPFQESNTLTMLVFVN